MMMLYVRLLVAMTLGVSLLAACSDDPVESTPNGPALEVRFDESTSRLNVTVHPRLMDGESLYVRVRNGPADVLNCAAMFKDMPRIDGDRLGKSFFCS